METKKRTQATDIAEIATKLDGKVKFSSIIYSQQMLSEKYRETGVNDMYFIGKKFGLWFYTSRAAYKWLSDQLGLPPEYTHIGMFNPETCAKVVDVSKKYLLTMRFALRRQDKIKAHFEPNGDEMLNRIKESLTRFFAADRSEFPEGYREIEDCFNQLPGEPYPTIAINDVGNDDRMIEFYVTGKQYDVYHVAFKGFTKC